MTKILVIEDELFIRENIVDCLEAEDFEVFSTENNSRLLKQAKLMKQYYDEQQKTKILKQKIKELEELQIKDKLSREYEQALLKISTAINLVKKIQPKPEDSSNVSLTERNLQTIRESCAAEIAMIRQLPHLEAQLCSKNKMLSLILQRF
jgi:CheY-like chemotaxis protein